MHRIRLGGSPLFSTAALAAALLAPTLGGCDGQPPDVTPLDGGVVVCVVNSDCGDGAYCGDGGFCVEGLPPGTCATDEDCEGEEVCIFPDGSDVGACLNPHECDTAEDCQEGQVCEDGDGDGYRDCLFTGCNDDAECVEEIGGDCTVNEEPKCIARACVCRDLCGAACGDGRQCCALPDTTATCIDDPGPCAMLDCEPGYVGAADTFGDWEAPLCDYADAQCACEELPPLPAGIVGAPHVLAEAPDGRVFAVGYNETYGDVVIAEVTNASPVVGWRHIDGVPEVSEEAPIVAGPSGPRGGVAAPGPDVGRWLDAAFTSNNTLHVVARDDTHGTLRHIYGSVDGAFSARDLDTNGDTGFAGRILFDGQDRPIVAHVVRNNGNDRTEVRVLVSSSPDDPVAQWTTYALDDFPLSDVACQGGCGEGEVCPDPGNDDVPVCVPEVEECGTCDGICTANGCETAATAAPFVNSLLYDSIDLVRSGNDLLIFGHDPRAGELIGHRTTGGNLFGGTAAFSTDTLLSAANEDLGGRPAATRGGSGFYVASTDVIGRRLTLLETTATLSIVDEIDIDDGERPHASGATSHHAVDNAALALDDAGEGIIAWQDGTTGAVWGRWLLSDGSLASPQILGGAGAGSSYAGFYGFSVQVASPPIGGPVVTAQRVWLGMDPPVSELVRLPAPARCPDDDPLEDNDDQASATPIDPSEAQTGIICADDEDFFEVTADGACTITAELVFRDGAGDLDLRLLDDAGTSLDSSTTTSDYETVSADVAAGTYALRVYGFSGAENGYALRVEVDCD